MYGKLINEALSPAPNPIHLEGFKIYNPSGEQYLKAGYLPVEETPYPEEPGSVYQPHWEEQDGKIIQVWEEAEPPEEPEPEPEPPAPAPELTPAQKREQIYNTEPIIEWEGAYLTVTEAAQKWSYYAAEGNTAKTQALTYKISEAKQAIREKCPDEEV